MHAIKLRKAMAPLGLSKYSSRAIVKFFVVYWASIRVDRMQSASLALVALKAAGSVATTLQRQELQRQVSVLLPYQGLAIRSPNLRW